MSEQPSAKESITGLEIAVIGMAGRFPGAGNIEEFWDNLKSGRETVTFFPDKELEHAEVDSRLIQHAGYVKAGPVLQDKECFDESFFGYTPREAEVMAPHLRIFYECAWGALEDAGYDPASYQGQVGCYAGSCSTYDWQLFSFVSGKIGDMDRLAALLLNDKDTLSSRLAYKLDLKGPCVTLHTACSTSLVAIHLACRGLLTGECSMALAGGITVDVSGKPGYLYQEGMIHSADGHNRTFDEKATGTVFGEGIGVVVLKRYPEALKDGDHIYAVIKGSAVNNDGTLRVGYTAPGTLGQRDVVKKALKVARVTPESITYIETHGTATVLGDPMEIEALKQAFNTGKKHFCALGAVKSNVGHLDIAAGITGFIKTVLALNHRLIPPTIHFETPNPKIDFETGPFYVNTELKEWKNENGPLRAGVSAFGIGGTNAHVVLEEAPVNRESVSRWNSESISLPHRLILLSAKGESALERMTRNLAEHLKKHPQINLADVAYTLQVGRRTFHHRRMSVCSTIGEAVENLENPGTGKVNTFSAGEENQNPPVIFMFSGLGSEYVNMGRDLYEGEPLFRREMDRCFEILKGLRDDNIKEILYPSPVNAGPAKAQINRTQVAQAVVFIFEYALARLLMHWGIAPRALIGYSFGEYVAACISGVFSLEEALTLVTARGELIAKTPPGAMLSVPLTRDELLPLLPPQLSLAIDNDISCLVAGPVDAVETFEKEMKEKRCICMRLNTSKAVHSPTMDPILEEFTGKAGEIKFHIPRIPYISNVTGTWISGDDAVNPRYWSKHLRRTVRFADGIKSLIETEKDALFIEIGPGRDISTLILRYLDHNPKQRVINLIRHPQQELSDIYFLLNKVGALWLYGVMPDWYGFYRDEKRQRVSLPAYSFEKHRYAAEGDPIDIGLKLLQQNTLNKKSDISDWFYQPSWKNLRPVINNGPEETESGGKERKQWLIFIASGSDVPELITGLVERLKQTEGNQVVTVAAGSEFTRISERQYVLSPADPQHYHRLFVELHKSGIGPQKILHLWGVTGIIPGTGERQGDNVSRGIPDKESVHRAQELGFYSLLYLARAMGKQDFTGIREINVLTDYMHEVVGEACPYPEKMTVLAPINVIPQEYQGIRCRAIDIDLPPLRQEGSDYGNLVDQLLEEIESPVSDTIVAFRGTHRWVRCYEPIHLKGVDAVPFRLKKGGVYFITGGLGGIGMILAENLFKYMGAKLVLTGRSPLPLSSGRRIRKLQQLKEQGAEVLVLQADAADEQQMKTALSHAEERFGKINGVIHAAGIVGSAGMQTIDTVDEAYCQLQFRSKVDGLLVLEKVLENKNLDFCLLMSSISSVLGGLGYTAYSAANLFMDGFVRFHNRRRPVPWISVNWDEWQVEEGGGPQRGMGASLARLAMTPEQGFDVFKRVLSWKHAQQVVISTGSLYTRIDQWIKLEALNEETGEEETREKQEKTSSLKPRPSLMTPYVEPQTPVEKSIAEILQHMFGYEKIGVEDDFFELGIDSIKLIQIRSRLGKRGYTAEMADFFQYPTISKLAPYVRQIDSSADEDLLTVDADQSPGSPAQPGNKELTPGDLTYKKLPGETFEQLKSQYPLEDVYALSPMQEGMMFYALYRRENTTTYFEQFSYRLSGPLEISLVERAVDELIKRHPILRTAFIYENLERPLQVVLKERKVDLYYKDLRDIPGVDDGLKEKFIREFIIKDRNLPFDLGKDILMRVAVFHLEDTRYQILWSLHHILMDGWCVGILISEFLEIYYSYLANKAYDLPPAVPYRLYIDWLENRERSKSMLYWQKYLEGYERAAGIPRKKTPGNHRSGYLDEAVSTLLGKETSDRLKQLAVRYRVTLNTVFQAIWGIVLGIYSGKQDVVFGSVVSGRPSDIPGVESMVGCFINTVPVRIIYEEKTKFKSLVKDIQERAIQSEPHHYCSLAEIQTMTPLKRDLLDHIIEFQNFPIAVQMEGVMDKSRQKYRELKNRIDVSNVEVLEQSNYDLNVMVIPGEQLTLSIAFNANAYERDLIRRIGLHCLQVMEQILDNEGITIGGITVLSEEERIQLVKKMREESYALDTENMEISTIQEGRNITIDFDF